MISFIAQRLVKAVIVLLALVVLNFFLIRMAPGDPALVMAGEAGAGDQIFVAQLREKFGLNQPLPMQLFLYVKGIVGLDLGFSFRQQMPVSTLEVGRLDFVKTARAKGLTDSVIQRRHVLRNALLPVVTLAGLQAGTLVGGAVLTETVFAWPGIGRLMYEALLQRDYNLLLGVFVVCSAMVLAFNLITDLIYRSVDPRIEFAS